MKICINNLKFLTSLVMLTAVSLNADIIDFRESSVFAYRYDMNVNPSTLDLDNNGMDDWFAGNAGGQTIPQTYEYVGVHDAWLAISDQSADPRANLFRTDFAGSITRTTLADENSPWTLELRVMKNPETTQGTDGWFGIAFQNPGATHSVRVNLADDRVGYWDTDEHLIGTDFSTGFHTVRIAYEGNNSYFVWVNEILLNDGLTTLDGFTGNNPTFNDFGALFVGDFSTGIDGDWAVDYIRYDDTGAYAIPEPTVVGLMTLAAFGLIVRRRI